MGKTFSDYTPDERRALGMRGGNRRWEIDEKRKTLRTLAEEYGRSKIKNQRIIQMLRESGIDPKDAIQDMLLILQCFNQISKGNPKWAEIYLKIRQEANPDFMELRRAELKLKKAELKLKEKLAEKQLAESESEEGTKPQVILYMPNKE